MERRSHLSWTRPANAGRGRPWAPDRVGGRGGFLLFLTALKLPSVAGSSTHPAGVALAALLFGPRILPALGLVVLLLQALLLAHGGLTTLGANLFSLAVCGGWAAWATAQAAARAGLSRSVAAA